MTVKIENGKKIIAALLFAVMLLSACGKTTNEGTASDVSAVDYNSTKMSEDVTDEAERKAQESPQMLLFRDVFGEEYEVEIDPDVAPNPYDNAKFRHEGDKLIFDDDTVDTMLGVDVSHHQGFIDWKKVKAQGYDFAILRIGYRGYGEAGNILKDKEFDRNIKNAKEAGLLVGVYFFAQAVNEEEAKEEAQSVLSWLDGCKLDLPVVYDPESILDDKARTDDVSGEQFTKNTAMFCETIAAAGYQPMIYANMLWEAYELDLAALSDYPVWYADYEAVPQTPYAYLCWQYKNEGNVDGVSGVCDLNIWMRKVNMD